MPHELDLPVEGEWLVLNPPGHARFAFDLVAVDPSSRRVLQRPWLQWVIGRVDVSDFSSWERPVVAPCAGRVVSVTDGMADRRNLRGPADVISSFVISPARHRADPQAMAGNHIVIATGHGHVLLAHLRQGTVDVSVGDEVLAGQVLARVGNSGNSVAPHLHLQLGDQPVGGEVLPFSVTSFEEWAEDRWVPRSSTPLPRRGRVRVIRSGR